MLPAEAWSTVTLSMGKRKRSARRRRKQRAKRSQQSLAIVSTSQAAIDAQDGSDSQRGAQSSVAYPNDLPDAKSVPKPRAQPEPKRGGILRGLLAALPFLGLLTLHLHFRSEGEFATALSLRETLILISVFTGLPALIAFAGLGRNLARRGPSFRLVAHGALLGAPTGLGLGILAAVPLGASNIFAGPWLLGGTALVGAIVGSALGVWTRWAR